jgi:Leucine-rich repeat (LRR) protein
MIVKKFVIFLIFIGSSFSLTINAQKYYTLKEAKTMPPDSVFYLKINRKKLIQIPREVFTYKRLKGLDLSKNRLENIPPTIIYLSELEILDLSKNRFEIFPKVIFDIESLRVLSLGSNQLTYIPNTIYTCAMLEKLDMYNNPITDLGSGLPRLKSLLELDLRGLMYNSKKQAEIRSELSGVNILFDAPCNCTD